MSYEANHEMSSNDDINHRCHQKRNHTKGLKRNQTKLSLYTCIVLYGSILLL